MLLLPPADLRVKYLSGIWWQRRLLLLSVCNVWAETEGSVWDTSLPLWGGFISIYRCLCVEFLFLLNSEIHYLRTVILWPLRLQNLSKCFFHFFLFSSFISMKVFATERRRRCENVMMRKRRCCMKLGSDNFVCSFLPWVSMSGDDFGLWRIRTKEGTFSDHAEREEMASW